MFRMIRGRAGAMTLVLALVGVLSLGLLAGAPGVGAAPAAQEKAERVGPIHVMALDNIGGGYAWAGRPRNGSGGGQAPVQAFAQATPEPDSFLLRITPGHWFILADSNTAPTLLVPGLDVWRMVVSADGQEGWAAGQVVHAGAAATPVLMRLHQGAWGSASDVLAPDYIPIDLTISADGQAGWLTARNAAGAYRLWRWDGTQWLITDQPAGGPLTLAAISPDGHQGWALSANQGLYGLDGITWGSRPVSGPATALAAMRLTADDAGNGWLLADQGAGDSAPSVLLRLTPANAPQEAALGISGPSVGVHLTSLAVDAYGQGWAVGTAGTQPVFVRLSGDSAQAIPAAGVSVPSDFALPATAVTVSADGATTWAGNAVGQMAALSVATVPGMPRTGNGSPVGALLALTGALLILSGCALLFLRRRTWLRV